MILYMFSVLYNDSIPQMTSLVFISRRKRDSQKQNKTKIPRTSLTFSIVPSLYLFSFSFVIAELYQFGGTCLKFLASQTNFCYFLMKEIFLYLIIYASSFVITQYLTYQILFIFTSHVLNCDICC